MAIEKALLLIADCRCDGCMQVGSLALKFVAHAGEGAFRKQWSKLRMELRSLKYLLALNEPCQNFRKVEIVGPKGP